MLQRLSIKYQKRIAFILFAIMYLETALPIVLHAAPEYRFPASVESAFEMPNLRLMFAGSGFIASTQRQSTSAAMPLHTAPARQLKNKQHIGGPGQPEMQSFQSVNASNMVDLFSGDFSYNIPLLDVGGYPINIHYTSGISMDQEASWVGLGWNINPGTISRNMRGLPDDFNGEDEVARTQHVKVNKTAGVTIGGDFELFGGPINVGASLGVFYNNYNGWGLESGINAGINSGSHSYGPLSGGLSLTNNSQTGLNVSPNLSVKLGSDDQKMNGRATLSANFNSRAGLSALQLHTEVRSNNETTKEISDNLHLKEGGFPMTASMSFAVPSYTPTISMPYTSSQYAFTVKLGGEIWGAHPNVYIDGYVSKQEIKPGDMRQSIPAFGYLYYTASNNLPNALLDINREKETEFNYNSSPMLAIPQYTYDLYTISGEGTGGSFRPYRGEIGYVRDHQMTTKSSSFNASVDLGFGAGFHVGADFIPNVATTQTSGWENSGTAAINHYIHFQKSDSIFQEVYFRNPGEKTSNTDSYYQSVGDDNLMRVKLGGNASDVTASNAFSLIKNSKPYSEVAVNTAPVKIQRDKRTQLINYLTAREAQLYGLDKTIKSYKENTIPLGNCSDTFTVIPRVDPLHKKHHLSEIDVTNADGRRYVYGLPAYNVEQKDVTFSVAKPSNTADIANGLVAYQNGTDNSVNNTQGKDNYFTQDSLPAFAHSFLLTGILSPDYVDITGDGISADDIGDAVKFNYSRIYGPDNNYFDWRAPYERNKANYNEGLKTYSRDDKGTYLYGKKEVWYLNSVESKTMIAVFIVKSDRQDGKAVLDENGGYDNSKGLRRLDEIDLYTKSDLITKGALAKPVKAVHFVYSYKLCPGIDENNTALAKLTLDSIWFSYNANYKGKINPYVFRYNANAQGVPDPQLNPSYNPKNYDRWGNYKNAVTNPASMSNVDFPYSIQDSATAAANATSWQLTDIQLPSSGHLKMTYESDDYAYVQNKRATQFFQIAGFGAAPTASPANLIYTSATADNYYLFVNTPVPVTSVSDLRKKYFGNNDTVYFKVAVKMPDDRWGTGYEFVPGYGVVASVGLQSGNPNQIWIQLKAINGESPVTRAALQFLRLNLPSKAYPGSEVGDDLDLSAAITMLASGYREIKNSIDGFDIEARKKGSAQTADLSRSFIRLTSPDYKKLGGGSRIKRIELYDHWSSMTGQRESTYGQEYAYTTPELVNGDTLTISSGVASYEPAIGNDENPFRAPIPYAEQQAPLAPVNYMFVETPVCESFFPAASVGYSRVLVRTINHNAKSANGWDETKFYTSRDFPTLVDYSVFDDYSKKRFNPKLAALLKINAKNYITLSQGFRVEINDMNGKMKSQASYPETDSLHPVKASYYYYKVDNASAYQKHLNNTVPVVDSVSGHINPNGTIGKDIEVMVDLREQASKTLARQVSPNVDFLPFAFFIIPIPSFWPLPQTEYTKFRSAATVKIVQRYGILDSMVVIDKGSQVSTKNTVYDGETGDVIVSRSNNEFNDPVYNFNYPAYWAYSGMGAAYKNIGTVFYNKPIMAVNGKLFYSTDRSDFPSKRYLESGDEIWIHANGIPIDPGCGVNHADISGTSRKVWVLDAAKGKERARGLYLIDSAGVPYTGLIDSLKIIRSGKRNMSEASAGSIMSLGNPVREVTSGNFRILIDNNTQIVHTSTTAYKDLWKVENTSYQKDTVIRVYHDFTIGPPVDATTFRFYKKGANNIQYLGLNAVVEHSPNIGTSVDGVGGSGNCSSFMFSTKTAINFNLDAIPAGSIITSATLSLTPKVPVDLFYYVRGISRGWLCSGRKESINWAKTSNYYYGTPTISSLLRITNAWSPATDYNTFSTTTVNAVSVDYNNYQSLNCTAVIQDMITSGIRQGLMFQINKQDFSQNYLDFCGRSIPNVNNVNNSNCNGPVIKKGQAVQSQAAPNIAINPGSGLPCDCTGPQLQISYRTLVDTIIQVCRQNIVDSAVNPYRWGILGAWRIDRNYSYYADRVESDASITQTNIRKEGVLKNFAPFWKFSDTALIAQPDTSLWVWNSAISMYNRKGFEIENFDPLGRYNAGLYGYNQTLPVAVSQNSKYRQALFDGFEDYNYKSQNCVKCAAAREFDFTTGTGATLSSAQTHTGLYSLAVAAGKQSVLTVPITRYVNDTTGTYLSMKIDSTPLYTTTIYGKGKGISGSYYGLYKLPFQPVCGTTITQTRIDPQVNFYWGMVPPFTTLCAKKYTVTWMGFVQAPTTDNYIFYGSSDNQISIKLKNASTPIYIGKSGQSAPIALTAGVLYPITVQYTHFDLNSRIPAQVSLAWSNTQNRSRVIIPQSLLYPQNMVKADSAGSVVKTIRKWCVKANYVKAQNVIRPVFSPIQSDKLVLSAWVRIDATDCNTMPALDNVISVRFNTGTNFMLARTGVRIEGWQRYEASSITVPSNATSMTITTTAPSGNNIFLDDVKMEPFNSLTKGYIYNPVNLRLMAELDENNYASFYEYDDDGTLIRIKKETERGIMTIKETRSALIKDN